MAETEKGYGIGEFGADRPMEKLGDGSQEGRAWLPKKGYGAMGLGTSDARSTGNSCRRCRRSGARSWRAGARTCRCWAARPSLPGCARPRAPLSDTHEEAMVFAARKKGRPFGDLRPVVHFAPWGAKPAEVTDADLVSFGPALLQKAGAADLHTAWKQE